MENKNLFLKALYFPARLMNSLSQIVNYPLTIIEAPSGFGKTTALNYYFEQEYFDTIPVYKRTFFGGSLSSSWNSFCNIIADIDADCAEILLNAGIPDADTITEIEECIQDIECNRETYIILDNFGDMRKDDTKIFLSALSRHGNKNLHIVVSTMQLPGRSRLSISMNNNIHMLTVSDFIFTREDTKSYFDMVGLSLSEEETHEVYNITGGWIFATYVQLLYYVNNGSFAKTDLDDLIEMTFWKRLDDNEKSFYISLSVLKSFTLLQACFITGKDSEFTKAYLKNNAFIHYDEQTYSFYFHALFSKFLSNEFELADDKTKKEIYIKSGQWEEKNDNKIYAMCLYHKAKAYDKIFAMKLTSLDIVDIEIEGAKEMIFDIIENTPKNIKIKYPGNLVSFAFALFFFNQSSEILKIEAEIREITRESNLSEKEKNAIMGEMELLLSFLEYNRIDKMTAHHKRALELLGTRASLINIKSSWTFGSPSILYLYHRQTGTLDIINKQMDECLPFYYKLTGGHGQGAEYILHAETEFMRGNFENSLILCYRAIFESTNKNQSSIYQCGLFLLARLAIMKNDYKLLSDVFEKIPQTASRKYTEDLCRYTPDLIYGYIYAFSRFPQMTAPWIQEGDISENRLTVMLIPFAQMIHAKILLEKHEYQKVLAYCMHVYKMTDIFPNILPKIYYEIFATGAYMALGKEDEAEERLEKALDMAMPDRLYMPFAENIMWIRPVLEKLSEKEEYSMIYELGGCFEKSLKNIISRNSDLSPREYEVAELIKQGFTNKQIAARLYISLSTVKMIISNIFTKTGIKSRAQLDDIDLKN